MPEEVRIVLDAPRAAALGVQIGDVVRAVSGAADVSGGFADVAHGRSAIAFAREDLRRDFHNLPAAPTRRFAFVHPTHDVRLAWMAGTDHPVQALSVAPPST